MKDFDTHHLDLEQKRDIIYKAKELCYHWRVDKLDCNENWARQRIEMSFEDIMKKFDNKCHFTIKYRSDTKNYLEVAFGTMSTGVDYFLWMFLEPQYLEQIYDERYRKLQK